VSQPAGSPDLKPVLNQFDRCAAEP
jgi:hypothetical protein